VFDTRPGRSSKQQAGSSYILRRRRHLPSPFNFPHLLPPPLCLNSKFHWNLPGHRGTSVSSRKMDRDRDRIRERAKRETPRGREGKGRQAGEMTRVASSDSTACVTRQPGRKRGRKYIYIRRNTRVDRKDNADCRGRHHQTNRTTSRGLVD
jgi:hypothetical protein